MSEISVSDAWFVPYRLKFVSPILTSRGSMQYKTGFYVFLKHGARIGTGECSIIEGLSLESHAEARNELEELCHWVKKTQRAEEGKCRYASVQFAWDSAIADLKNGGNKILYPSDFTAGKGKIPINGLIWMGDEEFMARQIQERAGAGFRCIKMKIGALPFEREVQLLDNFRRNYPPGKTELRLDANGAFTEKDVWEKLQQLAVFDVHSLEQPVPPGQHELMREICKSSPIPIALDEELIHIAAERAYDVIDYLKPAYLVIKPSLVGGFKVAEEFVQRAERLRIGWWVTSALESNIGLNALAQWVANRNVSAVQGLGTGLLYTNNVSSPLCVKDGYLLYDCSKEWGDISVTFDNP
ncbi:MAG: o-succinylbenzoate synthase [Chitinophagales bacterium]|nr:o-succinylbenzoate synthase [Chitinophagales bacterium]MDW8418322.1 o-succinylbenzoate synthase [Chitinophagales bacterium]